jgi:hypothetical protein
VIAGAKTSLPPLLHFFQLGGMMKVSCKDYKSGDMQILMHHIYEYRKGLRSLVLHTMPINELDKAEELLKRKGINHILQQVTSKKTNIFFGKKECIQIIKSFGKKSLSEFTDEEDFILGIMLGYDRNQQFTRYLERKGIIQISNSPQETLEFRNSNSSFMSLCLFEKKILEKMTFKCYILDVRGNNFYPSFI